MDRQIGNWYVGTLKEGDLALPEGERAGVLLDTVGWTPDSGLTIDTARQIAKALNDAADAAERMTA